MFNRNAGCHKPYMGVAPGHMTGPMMGVKPGSQVMGAAMPGYPQSMMAAPYCPPTQVSPAQVFPSPGFPTQVAPAQMSPTQQFVNTNVMNTVVPHVHPSHLTTVNKHVYTHQHHFPQTQSVVNECLQQQMICGPKPMMPMPYCCPPRPFGFI